MIFLAVLLPVLKFLYQNEKHGCIFFSVHSTVSSQCIKIHERICHHYELALRCAPVGLITLRSSVGAERPGHRHDGARQGEAAVPALPGCMRPVGRDWTCLEKREVSTASWEPIMWHSNQKPPSNINLCYTWLILQRSDLFHALYFIKQAVSSALQVQEKCGL